MSEYELMTILHSRLTADESAAAVEAVQAQIASHGGEVLTTDVWGRRRLAYPIGGAMEATYVLFTLNMPPEGTAPLEAWLGVSEQVIRHLLIRGIIPYTGRGQDDRDRDRDRDREDRDDRDDDRDDRDDRGRDVTDRPAMDAPAGGEMVAATASTDADTESDDDQ
jgi:small subunit ribosomal protein S6